MRPKLYTLETLVKFFIRQRNCNFNELKFFLEIMHNKKLTLHNKVWFLGIHLRKHCGLAEVDYLRPGFTNGLRLEIDEVELLPIVTVPLPYSAIQDFSLDLLDGGIEFGIILN